MPQIIPIKDLKKIHQKFLICVISRTNRYISQRMVMVIW